MTAPKLTRRSAKPGANFLRIRKQAQEIADTRHVQVFVYRMACGAHYSALTGPNEHPSHAGHEMVEMVGPQVRNKRTQRTMPKRRKAALPRRKA